MDLHVVVLAAGKGSRMKSAKPKVLHSLAGKPMLEHVLDTAFSLGAEKTHVVVGHGADQVRDHFAAYQHPLSWVEQTEQLGTGHAVAQAIPNIPDDAKVLILYGDVPLISRQSLLELTEVTTEESLGLLTVDMMDPTGYGRIVRNIADEVVAIVEQKDANEEQLAIQEVNTGFMCVVSTQLKEWLPNLSNSNAQGEYYLTDLIGMAVSNDKDIEVVQPTSLEEVQGVNDRLQLCELECWYQSQLAEALLLSGTQLYDPNRIDIRGKLVTGMDVAIDVNCVFLGNVELGDGVTIGPNCVLKNCSIAAGSRIEANSLIEESRIGSNAVIGPFARLRPGTELADNTKVGNFVETKKAQIGQGSKVNHLSYIGDAVLGENVNVGAGTITCNYDGVNKFKTELGDGVFVGSNSSLVAPVSVGDNATIGAGSVITKNVEPEQLAVARGRQANISTWKKPSKQ